MTEKQFTRAEVNKIVNKCFMEYFGIYHNDMTLSEKILIKYLHKTIGNMIDGELQGHIDKKWLDDI